MLRPLPPVSPGVRAETPAPPAPPGPTVVDEATPAADEKDTTRAPPATASATAVSAAPEPQPPAEEPTKAAPTDPDPTPLPEPATRDSLTLEEAAGLRAHLSQKGADKTAVLERFSVSESDWTRIEREHLKAIDEGVRAGDSSLLDRYDDAFLASQDEIRGPIDGAGYAKIQVARERGQLGAVLEELKVARGDLLRIDRVWRRRLATDRELAERVEDEMERLRDEQP